jgi:hypothetical protein
MAQKYCLQTGQEMNQTNGWKVASWSMEYQTSGTTMFAQAQILHFAKEVLLYFLKVTTK